MTIAKLTIIIIHCVIHGVTMIIAILTINIIIHVIKKINVTWRIYNIKKKITIRILYCVH